MEMGERIKMLREQRGMTLEELGNKIGVGKSTVRKWETGAIANMRRDKIQKLADALGVSPGYLMGWDDAPTSGHQTGYYNPETAKAAQDGLNASMAVNPVFALIIGITALVGVVSALVAQEEKEAEAGYPCRRLEAQYSC